MAINLANIELFQKGKDVDQICFLDNFYKNITLEIEREQSLSRLLTVAVSDSSNVYVKRSAFKILCELTLAEKITNRFSTLGILQNFLLSIESTLQVIALKYLPYFEEARTDITQEILNELSDSPHGEVASQAYFCLGLIQLTKGISQANIVECVITLKKAKTTFQAAAHSTENRVDAEFYILFIEWSEFMINNNSQLSKAKYKDLEKNLLLRTLYEFAATGIELDFLVFQLSEQIKNSFDIVIKSKLWLETQPQIQTLLGFNLEILKIKNIISTDQFLVDKLYNNVIKNLESSIYKTNLVSEKERLQVLRSQTNSSQLARFIEQIIAVLPEDSVPHHANNELLALFVGNIGVKQGLQQYENISNKIVSSEVLKAFGDLLSKNQNNQLSYRTGSIIGQEVLVSIMSQIDHLLPDYQQNKKEVFFNIVEEVIRYARTTFVENDKKRFSFLFTETLKGKGQKAVEQDLQDNMILFFEHSKIADGLEHEKAKFVDAGRVDILYNLCLPLHTVKRL